MKKNIKILGLLVMAMTPWLTNCKQSGDFFSHSAASATTLTDAQSVAADKTALIIVYNGTDSSAGVTGTLTLATSGSSGTTIAWAATYTVGGASASGS